MKTHNIVITTDQKQALAKNNPWPIVAAIGWRRLCKRESLPTKRTQQLLVRQLAAPEVEKLHALCGEAYKEIDQAVINSALELGLSDDTYHDLLSHIIGLGETEFNKTLKNPHRLKPIVDRRNYRENFFYCLPLALDKLCTFQQLQTQAVHAATELASFTALSDTEFKRIDYLRRRSVAIADNNWTVTPRQAKTTADYANIIRNYCVSDLISEIVAVGDLVQAAPQLKKPQPLPRTARLFLHNRAAAVDKLARAIVTFAVNYPDLPLSEPNDILQALRYQKHSHPLGNSFELAVSLLKGGHILNPNTLPTAQIAMLLEAIDPKHPLIQYVAGSAGTKG